MIYRGYPERDLVTNRSSLLLYGSTEAERRAWAEEVWFHFAGEGPLRVATSSAELRTALTTPRGVLYVPDISAIDDGGQSELVRLLRAYEERPKMILGVQGDPDRAREAGKLRSDLQYALQMAQVNLDEPGLKDAIRSRRAKGPKRPPVQIATVSASPGTGMVMKGPTASAPASASSASGKNAKSSSAKMKKAAPDKGRRSASRTAAPRAARRAPKPAAKKKARAPAKKSAGPRRRR